MKTHTLINSKIIFIITLIIIVLTVISVWFFGLGTHRTVIENSYLSTSILSFSSFLFISIGLYKGIKLKDNVGRVTDQFDSKKLEKFKGIFGDGVSDVPEVGEGIAGVLLSIVLWFIAAFVISYLFWFFSAILWITVLVFIAMLYWIFFRALRLILKKSTVCKGDYLNSILYGSSYTILYVFWIYGIILMIQYY